MCLVVRELNLLFLESDVSHTSHIEILSFDCNTRVSREGLFIEIKLRVNTLKFVPFVRKRYIQSAITSVMGNCQLVD